MQTFLSFLPLIMVNLFILFFGFVIISSGLHEAKIRKEKGLKRKKHIKAITVHHHH